MFVGQTREIAGFFMHLFFLRIKLSLHSGVRQAWNLAQNTLNLRAQNLTIKDNSWKYSRTARLDLQKTFLISWSFSIRLHFLWSKLKKKYIQKKLKSRTLFVWCVKIPNALLEKVCLKLTYIGFPK